MEKGKEREKRKYIMRWRLREILKEKGISQAAAARETGITVQQMSKLCQKHIIDAKKKDGIDFATLIKLYGSPSLKITPQELMKFEPINFSNLLVEKAKSLEIHVGTRPSVRVESEDIESGYVEFQNDKVHQMVGQSDLQGLAEITRQCSEKITPEIKLSHSSDTSQDSYPPPLDIWPSEPKTVSIGIGGPDVSKFADDFLCYYAQTLEGDFPFQFAGIKMMNSDIPRPYIKNVCAEKHHGIWWGDKLLFPIPPWSILVNYDEDDPYDDGCVIVIHPSGEEAWTVLVMGHHGNGTWAGSSFLFSEEFGDRLSKFLTDTASLPLTGKKSPALFVVLKVKCKRGVGNRESHPIKVDNGFDVKIVEWGVY